jgi:hypothetical protein
LKGFPDAKISDFTGKASRGKYGALKVPNYAAQIRMKPKQTIKFGFQTDLEKARFGDAFIFHLTHVVKRQVLGGLTVVAVRTKSETETKIKTKARTKAKR